MRVRSRSARRLTSSHFPAGLRGYLLRAGDLVVSTCFAACCAISQATPRSRTTSLQSEEPFFFAFCERFRERYAGKNVSTQDLVHIFEEELPRSLWFENRRSLNWFPRGMDQWGRPMPRLESARCVRITPKRERDHCRRRDRTKGLARGIWSPQFLFMGLTAGNSTVFSRAGVGGWTGNNVSPQCARGHS